MNEKKCLVLGATGFIGRHTIKPLLDQGYKVTAVYNNTAATELILNSSVSLYHCDLLNGAQVYEMIRDVQPTHLLHLAWDVKPGYRQDLSNISWLNASINLIDSFNKYSEGTKDIVIAGTGFEYNNDTLYGTCKDSLHSIVQRLNIIANIKWCRIYYLYGPYEHSSRLIPYIINSLLDGNKVLEFRSSAAYPFMYVEDVAQALVKALDWDTKPWDNQIDFNNCVSIDPTSLANKIASLMDLPPPTIRIGAEKGNRIIGDPRAIRSNYTLKFDLDRGLIRSIKYWRELRKI